MNVGYIVGNNGTILKTENSGINWVAEETSSNVALTSVFPYNEDLVFAVGAGGVILKRSTALPGDAGTITGETTVCQGTSDFIYTVPAIPNAETYHWSLPSGASGESITNSISVDFGENAVWGNISVYASNVNGDGATFSLAITVNEKPDMPVIMLWGNTLYSTVAEQYQWYKDEIAINGVTNQSYNVTENGDYYVIVQENGCFSEHSNVVTVTHVSFNKLEISDILIAPNPTSDKLIINALEIEKIKIFDLHGNIVFSVNCNSTDSYNIDVSNLQKGIYIIKIQTNYYKEIKKIIVK